MVIGTELKDPRENSIKGLIESTKRQIQFDVNYMETTKQK
jgi:hypothetical protein